MKVVLLAWTPVVGFSAMLVAQLANMTIGAQNWVGEPLLSAEWVATALYLVGPLLAAVAAFDGARLFPIGSATVWNQTGIRQRLTVRLWVAGTACAFLPTAAVACYTALRARPTFVEAQVSAALVLFGSLASVAILIGIGLILGRTLGRLYGVLLAAAVAFALQMISANESASVMQFGGTVGSMLGLRLTWLAATSVAVGSLTAVLVLYAGLCTGANSRYTSWSPLNGIIVTAVVFLLLGAVPMAGIGRYTAVKNLDDEYGCSPPMASADFAEGTLCIYNEHDRLTDRIDEVWTSLAITAIESGSTLFPENLRELPPASDVDNFNFDTSGKTAYFTLVSSEMSRNGEALDEDWLINEVVQVPWCPALWTDAGAEPRFHDTAETARYALTNLLQAKSESDKKEAARAYDVAWKKLSACEGAR